MISKKYTVDFEPIGKRVEVKASANILEAAQAAGVEIVSVCGGLGTCERCRVQTIEGDFSAYTVIEELAFTNKEREASFRLACMTEVLSSCKIHIPPDSLSTPQRLQLEGLEGSYLGDNPFHFVEAAIARPSLEDLRSDALRLIEFIEDRGVDRPLVRYPVLRHLSETARELDWKFRVVLDGREIAAILPPKSPVFGLAVDIGTTKVAAYLLDLESAATVGQASAMNPQIHFGEDVISRIHYCIEHDDGRNTLQARIMGTLNDLLENLYTEANIRKEQVVGAVVVGNTAMHHLFAGLPVSQLGLLPFVPSVNQAVEIPAGELGLHIAPGAVVYLPPNIAGYVGADHVSMVLASAAHETDKTTLAVDIGTNTEISLLHDSKISCCSCASGPAFEGAHIREGMRAAAGAIEKVQIHDNQVSLMTIGGISPVGICGSGILDAVAEMVRSQIIDPRGVIRPGSPLVRGSGKTIELVLAAAPETGCGRDLTINRRDINEILLAKAAIRTGIDVLLENAGISAEDIDHFIVAGAFGTYLDLRSTIQIGMFPSLPLERFSQVGNAAGSGARQMLMSAQKRGQAEELARQMEYIELTSYPNFKEIFYKSLAF
jgi:uncharacterized 2Fe-2S/4Fe-4S cluster protein (DUF4445 family)